MTLPAQTRAALLPLTLLASRSLPPPAAGAATPAATADRPTARRRDRLPRRRDVDLVRVEGRRAAIPRGSPPRARVRGVDTVYIKAGDGADNWSQFTPALVADAASARGLHVCAWQYVYGNDPVGEAARRCGRGRRWRRVPGDRRRGRIRGQLRRRRGRTSPGCARAVGDDLPARARRVSPTSTTTRRTPTRSSSAPGGAEFNLPQVYWKAIGDSVDRAIATTYTYNRVYGRPISPIGQLYDNPPRARGAALPPAREGDRLRRHLVVVVAARLIQRLPLRDPAPHRPHRAATARAMPTRRSRRAPRATSSSGPRSTSPRAASSTPRSPAATACSPRAACGSSRATVGLSPTGMLDAPTWKALLAELDPIAVELAQPRQAGRRRRSRRARRARPACPRARTSSAESVPRWPPCYEGCR